MRRPDCDGTPVNPHHSPSRSRATGDDRAGAHADEPGAFLSRQPDYDVCRLEFSEPLDPATVTAANVSFSTRSSAAVPERCRFQSGIA